MLRDGYTDGDDHGDANVSGMGEGEYRSYGREGLYTENRGEGDGNWHGNGFGNGCDSASIVRLLLVDDDYDSDEDGIAFYFCQLHTLGGWR